MEQIKLKQIIGANQPTSAFVIRMELLRQSYGSDPKSREYIQYPLLCTPPGRAKRGLGGDQWLPLHLLSGHCTYVGTFAKIVPIRPDVGLLFEMSRHGQVVVVGTIYSSS